MNPHIVTKLADHTWHIGELQTASVYLLEGKEKALLIDTAQGLGNIKAEVRKLTALPLQVVLTHSHPDHAGGMGYFKDIYLHAADLPSAAAINEENMLLYLESFFPGAGYKSHPIPVSTRFHTIREGHVFELGERSVTVYEVPGHTLGSIALLDSQTGFLFTGDACNHNLLLSLPAELQKILAPGSCFSSVELCMHSLQKIKSLPFKKNFTGHFDEINQQPADPATADDLITSCARILAGEVQPDESVVSAMNKETVHFCCIEHGSARISYDPQKIHEDWVVNTQN